VLYPYIHWMSLGMLMLMTRNQKSLHQACYSLREGRHWNTLCLNLMILWLVSAAPSLH